MISTESFIIYFLMMGLTGTLASIYIQIKGERRWWWTLTIMFVFVFCVGIAVFAGDMHAPRTPTVWSFLVFMPWVLCMKDAANIFEAEHERKLKDVEIQSFISCVNKRKAQEHDDNCR